MKGKRLLDEDPTSLSDTDLEIQVGALVEEIEKIETELAGIDNVRSGLETRLAELNARVDTGRNERGNRGQGNQGQGQGNN